MNLELNVVRFENEDVIATSCATGKNINVTGFNFFDQGDWNELTDKKRNGFSYYGVNTVYHLNNNGEIVGVCGYTTEDIHAMEDSEDPAAAAKFLSEHPYLQN